MRQFVPMTDEMLCRPDLLPGPLVPYHCGIPCLHALRDGVYTFEPSAMDRERVSGFDAQLLGRPGV